jgi:hypothetical protein
LVNLPANVGTNGDIYVVSGDGTAINDGRTFISDGSNWNEVTANLPATDARYVQLAGSTMTGNLTVPTGKKIFITDAPSSSTDAANKAYVDSKIATEVVDATSSTAGKIKLTGDLGGTASSPTVPGLADKAPINNPTFTGTVGGLSKSMVNLANVDNTSDADKPISNLAQNALDLKAPKASPTFTGTTTFTGTVFGISKNMVDLSNVDNTSDANKPVSQATINALTAKESIANKSIDVQSDAASDEKYPSVKAIKTYVDNQVTSGGTPNADDLTLGKIKLAGDLGGPSSSASSPVISNAAISTVKLADLAVTTGKIDANAVTSTKILDGTIVTADLAADAVTSTKILDGTIVTADLADNSITSAKIANGEIDNADISATAAIADTKLATLSTAGKVSNSATTATNANTLSAIVARDANGNFSAGTITASAFSGPLTGNVTGNVTGNLTGNASTASVLATSKNINGTAFDGSTDITVTAAAGTLTGSTLNASVLSSSLTTVGTLANLTVTNPIAGSVTGNAATVTTNANLTGPITSNGNATSIASQTGSGTKFVMDTSPILSGTPEAPTASTGTNTTQIATTAFVTNSVAAGAPDATTTVTGKIQLSGDLGGTNSSASSPVISNAAISTGKLADLAVTTGKIDANAVTSAKIFDGTIATADLAGDAITSAKILDGTIVTADLADNSITSAKIGNGEIVNADISSTAAIADTKLATLSTAGKVSNSATTATNANTVSAIVARDANGNFSAGTITASAFSGPLTGNVTGNVTGNASTATSATSFSGNLGGDVTGTQSATLVGKINGTSLAGLSTGLLKNTTSTGVPTIAQAGTDYIAPYTSQTANYVLSSPNGSAGTPSFRALVAADIPTLNQNTNGSAGSVVNAITFANSGGAASGTTFNGSAAKTIDYSSVGASPLAGSSSLTTVGTIGTGTWNATVIAGQYGGTGVANTGKTITLGGNISIAGDFTTLGAFATTLTSTATTSLTLPTTGTLATLTGTETLTNKTLTNATFSAPILGTPASGTLTNATGLPLSSGVTGTLPVANGGTGLSTFTSGGAVYASSTSALTTGTLPVTAGGTGASTLTSGYVKGNGTSALSTVSTIPVADISGAAPLAGPTFSGTVTIPIASVTGAITAKNYVTTVPASTTATTSTSIDFSTGNIFKISLGTNITTLSISNAVAGTYLIEIIQGGTYTVAFPAAWKWSGGSAPTITATSGKTDIITLVYDGTTYFASAVQNF